MISRIMGMTAEFVLSLPIFKLLSLLVSDKIPLYFLKLIVNETETKPQVNKTNLKPTFIHNLNLATAYVNDCSKAKLHELIRSLLKFIFLGMNFSDHSDQWITDLLFDTNT